MNDRSEEIPMTLAVLNALGRLKTQYGTWFSVSDVELTDEANFRVTWVDHVNGRRESGSFVITSSGRYIADDLPEEV